MADNIVLNYVWIDGFRGLNNVGFNLGGEYRYNFLELKEEPRENNTYKKIHLSVNENEKYVEGFFSNGENENNISLVSAIVGNNGAGKTSFMRALKSILSEELIFDRDEFDYVLVYTEKGEVKYHSNAEVKFKSAGGLFESKPRDFPETLCSVFYSSMIDGSIYPLKMRAQLEIKGQRSIKRNYDVSSNWLLHYELIEYERYKRDREVELLNWKDTERQIEFMSSEREFYKKNNLIRIPEKMIVRLERKLNRGTLSQLTFVEEKGLPFNKLYTTPKKNRVVNTDQVIATLIDMTVQIRSLLNKPNKPYKSNKIILQYLFELIESSLMRRTQSKTNKIFFQRAEKAALSQIEGLKKPTSTTDELERYIASFLNCFIESLDEEDLFEFKYDFSSLKDDSLGIKKQLKELCYSTLKLFDDYTDKKERRNAIYEIQPQNYNLFRENNRLLNKLLTIISYKTVYNKKQDPLKKQEEFILFNFDWNMSTGEKLMFNLFSRFHYAKKQMEENGVDDASSVLILIDEGELGFHLEWQRKYIDALVQVFPLIFGEKRPLQIIFTTHSPVSLSDIPRDNVVFLKKSETEESKEKSKEKGNAPEDKEYIVKVVDDPIETFGANIHAIVRNGFFLEDGAMGEFAKRKITKIFDRISKAEHSKRLEKEIDLIDEPIIRRQLKKKYEENLSIEEKINLRKAEIEELQAQLNKKEHDQNK